LAFDGLDLDPVMNNGCARSLAGAASGWLAAQLQMMASGDEPGPAAEAPLRSDLPPPTASEPEPAEAGKAHGALAGA